MNILNVGYASTNYYLLGPDRARLLVDIGWSNTLPQFLSVLKRHDLSLSNIRYLLATHYHPDHAGLAQELKAQGVSLIVMESQTAAIPLLKKHMKPINRYLDIQLDDNIPLTFQASRSFLAQIGIAGEIIPTSGHSDDSVSLVLDEGIAFTGDLTPPIFLDETQTVAAASWDKLRAHHVKTIYPGHGPSGTLNPT